MVATVIAVQVFRSISLIRRMVEELYAGPSSINKRQRFGSTSIIKLFNFYQFMAANMARD